MITLALPNTFSFHPSATLTVEQKSWLTNLSAMQIILNQIRAKLNQTTYQSKLYFLRGRTGSGKSTYMISNLYSNIVVGTRGQLICTEPRVVLTRANATDVIRYSNDWKIGNEIGILTGSEKVRCKKSECIYYCTPQILNDMLLPLLNLNNEHVIIQHLSRYSIIVVDEVHVLDLPMMSLLKVIRDCVRKFYKYSQCPVFIFASATIDIDAMIRYYFSQDSDDSRYGYSGKYSYSNDINNIINKHSYNINNIDNNIENIDNITNDIPKPDEVIKDPLLIGDVAGTSNFHVDEEFLDSKELSKYNAMEAKLERGGCFKIIGDYVCNNMIDKLFKSNSYVKAKKMKTVNEDESKYDEIDLYDVSRQSRVNLQFSNDIEISDISNSNIDNINDLNNSTIDITTNLNNVNNSMNYNISNNPIVNMMYSFDVSNDSDITDISNKSIDNNIDNITNEYIVNSNISNDEYDVENENDLDYSTDYSNDNDEYDYSYDEYNEYDENLTNLNDFDYSTDDIINSMYNISTSPQIYTSRKTRKSTRKSKCIKKSKSSTKSTKKPKKSTRKSKNTKYPKQPKPTTKTTTKTTSTKPTKTTTKPTKLTITSNIPPNSIQCRDMLIFVPLSSGIEITCQTIQSNLKKSHPSLPVLTINKNMHFDTVLQWRNQNRNKPRLLLVGFARDFSHAGDEILSKPIDPDPEVLQNETKIVVATPVIETGKTITTLYICIDTGLNTSTVSNPLIFDFNNPIKFIKQIPANMNQTIQRMGRVGREAPGIYLHFYSKEVLSKFQLTDTPDTINNSCLSGILMTHFARFDIFNTFDVMNENHYLFPTSIDIMIRTMHDLIKSGMISIYGEIVDLRTNGEYVEIWILYAMYLYYILKYPLYISLIIAAVNRKTLPQVYNIIDLDPNKLKYKLNDILRCTDEHSILEGIAMGRNKFTYIKYSSKNRLPLVYLKDRAFGDKVYEFERKKG